MDWGISTAKSQFRPRAKSRMRMVFVPQEAVDKTVVLTVSWLVENRRREKTEDSTTDGR